eukprot:8605931-Pyramimonas_sp.AAC.1
MGPASADECPRERADGRQGEGEQTAERAGHHRGGHRRLQKAAGGGAVGADARHRFRMPLVPQSGG